jgi:hypothetical protein
MALPYHRPLTTEIEETAEAVSIDVTSRWSQTTPSLGLCSLLGGAEGGFG